jgi:hypothetical protein
VPEGYAAARPLRSSRSTPVAGFRRPAFARPDPVRLAREALRALFDWWEARIAACEADGSARRARARTARARRGALPPLLSTSASHRLAQALQLRELDTADPRAGSSPPT